MNVFPYLFLLCSSALFGKILFLCLFPHTNCFVLYSVSAQLDYDLAQVADTVAEVAMIKDELSFDPTLGSLGALGGLGIPPFGGPRFRRAVKSMKGASTSKSSSKGNFKGGSKVGSKNGTKKVTSVKKG